MKFGVNVNVKVSVRICRACRPGRERERGERASGRQCNKYARHERFLLWGT